MTVQSVEVHLRNGCITVDGGSKHCHSDNCPLSPSHRPAQIGPPCRPLQPITTPKKGASIFNKLIITSCCKGMCGSLIHILGNWYWQCNAFLVKVREYLFPVCCSNRWSLLLLFLFWISDHRLVTKVLWEQWPWWPCVGSRDSVGLLFLTTTVHIPGPAQPDHFLPTEDALLHRIQSTGSSTQPFSVLITHNCTQALFFKRANLFHWFVCHAMSENWKKGWQRMQWCTRCVCACVDFSWRTDWRAGLAVWHTQPAKQSRYRSPPLQNCSTLCESTTRAPRTDPDARTHTLAPKQHLESGSQPRLVLTAFLSHPAHRAVTLRWPSHHLKLVWARAYWICPQEQSKNLLHSVHS